MDTKTIYTLSDLASLWDIHYETLHRLIAKGEWRIEKIYAKRYYITDDEVIELMHNNPHIQWLAQNNYKNKFNASFLALLKSKYPGITPAYSHHEISEFFHKSSNWFYYHKKKGDFSGLYIRSDEIFRFVFHNREYIRDLRKVRQGNDLAEQLRRYVLSNLKNAGVRI